MLGWGGGRERELTGWEPDSDDEDVSPRPPRGGGRVSLAAPSLRAATEKSATAPARVAEP